MSEPRISVVVPNYNHGQYLARCLNALLNQSVPPHEIIIVDDASTDHSLAVLREYAHRNSIIRVYENEVNLGVNATINRGMALASGDYLLFTAADDEVRPGIFSSAIRMLHKYPQAGLVSGVCEWRDESKGLNWYVGGKMPREECYLTPQDMVALGQNDRLAICNQNAVFRKSALVEAGGWQADLRWFSDWYGGYVVGFRYGIVHVPEVLSTYYLYATSYYNSVESEGMRRDAMLRLLENLESPMCADVAPFIAQSGILGSFGWPMLRIVYSEPSHRRFRSVAFLRGILRRCAERTGRRLFPNWLARLCLKMFYKSSGR